MGDGHIWPLILLSSKGAGPESRSVAGHVTTAVRFAPRRYISRRRWMVVVMPQVTPTIPIASVRGGDPELSISNEDWKSIEFAYGHDVPTTAREQIYDATLRFLFFVEGEQAARPVSEARKRIERLKKAASVFQKAVFDYNPQDIGRDSRVYADHLVGRYFDDERIEGPKRLRSLGLVMSSLMVACRRALADLKDPTNYRPPKGWTWRNWVCRVAEIAEAHQLPTEVRKDTTKSKDTDQSGRFKPSPFVVLIGALQDYIPERYRQSTHSGIALSAAIARARRSLSGHKANPNSAE
jgi:hypothetical protein